MAMPNTATKAVESLPQVSDRFGRNHMKQESECSALSAIWSERSSRHSRT
ncbi:unnamed protein product [Ectocarpus sp. 13 AM-2016]